MCGLLTLVVSKARTTALQIYTKTMCFPCKLVYWIIYNLNSFPVLFICWLYVHIHKTIFCYFFALLIHNGCHFPSFTVSLVFVVGWWVCYWIFINNQLRVTQIFQNNKDLTYIFSYFHFYQFANQKNQIYFVVFFFQFPITHYCQFSMRYNM